MTFPFVRQVRSLTALVSVLALIACAFAGTAQAKRAPTSVEGKRIKAVVFKNLGNPPAACVGLRTAVSTVSSKYALSRPVFKTTDECIQYASNGYFLLTRTASGFWHVAFNGSDSLPCTVPRAVRVDLGFRTCF